MNWKLKHALDALKRELASSPPSEKQLAYAMAEIEAEAVEMMKRAETESLVAKAMSDNRERDHRLITDLLDSKRLQFAWSFGLNVLLVVVIAALYLAEKLAK